MRTEYITQRPQLTSYTQHTLSTHTSVNKTTHKRNNNNKERTPTTIRSSTPAISKISTDDITFALTEVYNLDKKIKRISEHRNKIWKNKVDNNFYESEAMKNHQELQKIKAKVRNEGGWEAIDLKKEIHKKKYFPVEEVNTLYDSDKIKTQINFRKQRNDTYQDLFTFSTQNRQICLKNILIDLLKDERNTIAVKEKEVSTALESANKTFDKDVKDFYAFTAHQKVVFHNIETKLAEKIRINKALIEDKRTLTLEYKRIQDEIEKNIRGIIQNKQYADFVHRVLGGSTDMLNIDLSHIDLMKKDKDIDKIISYFKASFRFLHNPHYDLSILKNPILLNNLFFQLEANIIKSLSVGEEIRNDLHKLKLEQAAILKELEEKEQLHINERDSLIKDSIYKSYLDTKNDDLNDDYKFNHRMILDLFKNITQGDDDNNNINMDNDINDKHSTATFKMIRNKPTIELIREIFGLLDKKEQMINKHQEELSKMEIEAPEVIKKIVDKVKNKNKIQKWREGKEKMRQLEEQRNLKYQQRSNRYKLQGQITFPLPGILQKRKLVDIKKSKLGNEDYDMLYY